MTFPAGRFFSLTAVLILFAVLVSPTQGQETIVGYDTTNPNADLNDPSPDLEAAESAAGIVAMDYARGPGLTPNAGITLNSSGWTTSPTLNLNSDDYLSWGWTAGPAYDLTNMTLQYDRNENGPQQMAIALSANGGAYEVVFTDNDVFLGDETATFSLATFDNVTSAEFRLFAYDSITSTGTFDLEEFEISPSRGIVVRGGLSPVPEPGSIVVLLAGGGMLCLRRRRK